MQNRRNPGPARGRTGSDFGSVKGHGTEGRARKIKVSNKCVGDPQSIAQGCQKRDTRKVKRRDLGNARLSLRETTNISLKEREIARVCLARGAGLPQEGLKLI